MKFVNFDNIFAIRGPKLDMEVVRNKIFKHKVGGLFFLYASRGDGRGVGST